MPGGLDVVPGIPGDWAGLASGAPAVAQPRWITFGRSWYPGDYHTFALRDPDGRCSAALGGALLPSRPVVARRDPYAMLSGQLARDGFLASGPHPWQGVDPADVFPCLLLMYPNYQAFPLGPGAHDPAVLRRLVHELLQWGRRSGARSVVFLHLTPRAAPLTAVLAAAGFRVGHLIDRCDLPVTWDSFDGYLGSLPSKRRVEVRRELGRIAQRGLDPVRRPLADDEPELLALRCQLVEKYTGTVDPAQEAAMLSAIRAHVPPEDLQVFALVADSRTVSCSLFVRDGQEWTAMMTGSDYTDARSSLGYFSTLFYQPAQAAAEAGIRLISYGPASVDAKRRRGCVVSPCLVAELPLDGHTGMD
ncbi:MAG: GNAT family N-acetyltransferase [Angustibacter sp.]